MRHCYVLNVFTRDGAGGNPLGVVTDTVGLDAAVMQAIAAELGYSETIYVDWQADHTPAVRIFTPAVELPFAGHPLVGAAWLLNTMGPGAAAVRCGIGEVGMWLLGDAAWVSIPAYPRPVAAAEPDLAESYRLPDLRAVHWVHQPLPYLVAGAESSEAVAAAAPDLDAMAGTGHMVLLYAGTDPVRARFFAPDHGVPEDPATGSAAVALATVLHHRGEAAGDLVIHQGEEMGFPSEILLQWDGDRVRLGGKVVQSELLELER